MASVYQSGADAVKALIAKQGKVIICVRPDAKVRKGEILSDFGNSWLPWSLRLVAKRRATRAQFEAEVRMLFTDKKKPTARGIIGNLKDDCTFWTCGLAEPQGKA